MGALGGFEWVLIIFAIVLLFGAKRLPGLARGIGEGIREFRKIRSESDGETD
ncbi:MAG: twin-arginine translocase TatA/TatE family subunit [Balneolaceae bacterium]